MTRDTNHRISCSTRKGIECIVLILAVFAPHAILNADTLSLCNRENGYVYYRHPEVTMFAARFPNPAPGYLTAVHVSVGGPSSEGSFRLRVYGSEGGNAIPTQERDLIRPITLRKSRSGYENFEVSIPDRPFLQSNQFFIVVDRVDEGVELLSDREEKAAWCVDETGTYRFQLLKETSGRWRSGKYAFLIDAVMSYEQAAPKNAFTPVSTELGLIDTVKSTRSFAWGDVDRNGLPDLVWDGRLYLNDMNSGLRDVTDSLGLEGSPRANFIQDFNNDGYLDVIYLGSTDTGATESVLFLGDENFDFSRVVLDGLPEFRSITGVALGDVDGDGDVDIFVAQGCSSEENCFSGVLLNEGGDSFRPRGQASAWWNQPSNTETRGVQIIDIDQDGSLDLYLAYAYPHSSRILFNSGKGEFSPVHPQTGAELTGLGPNRGGDWQDYDNDLDLDLLSSRSVHPFLVKFRDQKGSNVVEYVLGELPASSEVVLNKAAFQLNSHHGGGTWGDFDNDGDLDALITAPGTCAFPDLYQQQDDHTFIPVTFEYGLFWTHSISEAVWVDYNGDGWLDISALRGNRFEIFKNPGAQGAHVQIKAVDNTEGTLPGTIVRAYSRSGIQSRTVTVGRGELVGDPLTVHFGLGVSQSIDSVVVIWPDGVQESYDDLILNQTNTLRRGNGGTNSAGQQASITAYPNPFENQLRLFCSVPKAGDVKVSVHSLDGKSVAVIFDGYMESGRHTLTWDGFSDQGESVSNGAYVYSMVGNQFEVSGRVVLNR